MSEAKNINIEVKIIADEDVENPRRSDFSNISKMVCFHGRYNLGDGSCGYKQSNYSSWDELKAAIIKKSTIRDAYGLKLVSKRHIEKAIKSLEIEIEIYNQYLSGEIYTYIVEDMNSNGKSTESCGGIYGYKQAQDEAKQAVKRMVDCILNEC